MSLNYTYTAMHICFFTNRSVIETRLETKYPSHLTTQQKGIRLSPFSYRPCPLLQSLSQPAVHGIGPVLVGGLSDPGLFLVVLSASFLPIYRLLSVEFFDVPAERISLVLVVTPCLVEPTLPAQEPI